MTNNNSVKTKIYKYIIAFLLPAFLFCIILIIKKITPFGNNTLLCNDMLAQYAPFYTELAAQLKSHNFSLFSWTRGLGFDTISESAYYVISPLNFILIFFTNKTMPIAITILLILKCSFAGLNMTIYMTKHYKMNSFFPIENNVLSLIFSTVYALCSYFVCYSTNIIWIDCFALFPLIIISLERLVDDKKPYLFTVYLSLAILSNYYVGYMICIFCFLYFIYLISTNTNFDHSIKNILKTFFRFCIYSITSGLLCAFILIPTIFSLSTSDAASMRFYDKITSYYPFAITFFRQMLSARPTYWHYPYLYSTDLIFFVLPIYFFKKEIALREKIGKSLLLVIMILSFQINALDFIWNGFHLVNCFAGRQSFIYIFLVLTMCFDVIKDFSFKKSHICFSYILSLCLFLYVNYYFNYTSTFKCVLLNTIIITLYLIVLLFNHSKRSTCIIISLLLISELCLSIHSELNTGITYNEYVKNIDTVETNLNSINDSEFYRVKNDTKTLKNEGSIINYKSLSTYSSLANINLSNFINKLGYPICLNAIGDNTWEPVTASIFAEKYIISSNPDIICSSLKKIASANNTYIYKNENALSIGFEVPTKVLNKNTFNGNNPFERINNFSMKIADCGRIYTPVEFSQITNIAPQTELYIYSMKELSHVTFNTTTGSEELYSNNNTGATLIKNAGQDNYIYYVCSSPVGGSITLPDNIDASQIIAYQLNISNFNKLMTALSSNQIKISSFSDSHITGSITAAYNGVVMTSIPYNKGWTVKVDGKKVKTASIENALLAFSIPKGNHTISFSYMPKGFLTGSLITLISFLLLIILTLIRKSKHQW